MSKTYFRTELERLHQTYRIAYGTDVTVLKEAIAGASESSVIGVGSGGSFTVASLLCNLHETYTGRVSRAATPLEIICNPTLAAASPVFLISAEGKNPDIVVALERARHHSARAVHVLTNRSDSLLMASVSNLTDVSPHLFEIQEKDGYLATNSLLMDAVLVAKAYGELDGTTTQLPPSFDQLEIGGQSIEAWVQSAMAFVKDAAQRGAIIVTYSPLLRPVAADLESKLAESALLHCQLADLRSFAHGRHLWLADRPSDVAILALTDPTLEELWLSMKALFPKEVPTLAMPLSGSGPRDLIAGLVAQMYLVDALATQLKKDPGRPQVPQFGRDLYYADLPKFVPHRGDRAPTEEQSKYDVLGARWPSPNGRGDVRRARQSFARDMAKQQFRALVFDYDGTLCSSQRKASPPPPAILKELTRLVDAGICIGIASGRGKSIHKSLESVLPPAVREKIHLGLYNGGWLGNALTVPTLPDETVEFLSHVTRIVHRLKALGVPIVRISTAHPYQVSVRFREGLPTDQMWFIVADALRQAGLMIGTTYRSKHSIDVLAPGVSKSGLVAHIIQSEKIDPYQILTMGDQGAWPGNDAALLEHRFSLSVDLPSRRLDRAWKLAPPHKRDVDATLWYLERVEVEAGGWFTLDLSKQNQIVEV